ncbi:MarR family transcriptional regulator [Streptomyces fragilis]|uniref:MarR family transcriptional regulator n=2 Tax=Streptomyces fragilis TaxID=67301 RepID=A0ABV2YEL6_9ACTN|nr:MarR family transcriptional regulator [Streptomyces fragilis]
MTGVLDGVLGAGARGSLDRAGYERLSGSLAECGREEFTGELRVQGRPGGSFHLRGGLVVGVESPGAPGPEALLLRSGRVTGERWTELVRGSGGRRWPEDELVADGCVGAAQLRVVCMLALQDAAFAMVAGRVEECERHARGEGAAEPVAPVGVGETAGRLLQEAVRKLTALDGMARPVRPERETPAVTAGAGAALRGRLLTPLRREVLAAADGRSTARDLAFRLGRGVYVVTVEVARLLEEHLLDCPGGPAPVRVGPLPGVEVLPRVPVPRATAAPFAAPASGPGREGAATQAPVTEPSGVRARADPADTPQGLPRREPGASGITEALGRGARGKGWKEFFRRGDEPPR